MARGVVLACMWFACASCRGQDENSGDVPPSQNTELQQSIEIALHGDKDRKSLSLKRDETLSLFRLCSDEVRGISVKGSEGNYSHSSCARQKDRFFELVLSGNQKIEAKISLRNDRSQVVSFVNDATGVYLEKAPSENASSPLVLSINGASKLISSSDFQTKTQPGHDSRTREKKKAQRDSRKDGVSLREFIQTHGVDWTEIEDVEVLTQETTKKFGKESLLASGASFSLKLNKQGMLRFLYRDSIKPALRLRGVEQINIHVSKSKNSSIELNRGKKI